MPHVLHCTQRRIDADSSVTPRRILARRFTCGAACLSQRQPRFVFTRVLMVCTGNICRSPMAQVLLARTLKEHGVGAVVESAGLSAVVGSPADPLAVELMKLR